MLSIYGNTGRKTTLHLLCQLPLNFLNSKMFAFFHIFLFAMLFLNILLFGHTLYSCCVENARIVCLRRKV